MANNEVFFCIKNGEVTATTTASGNPTLADPVTLGPVTVYSPYHGGYMENTAVSGTEVHLNGVYPSDYPADDDERKRRVRSLP